MSAMPDIAIVAVDWGTTNMRVWSVDREGRIIHGEMSADGMGTLKPDGFAPVLDAHLKSLGAGGSVPVIICGMAGSRQGWQEADYVSVPARLDDLAARSVGVAGESRDIRILPGVADHDENHPDVMRSEETQLLALTDAGTRDGIVCMPGTHAKWVTLRDATITGFRTAMTGELFHVVATHSVLRHSLGEAEPDASSKAFEAAVRESLADPTMTLSRLFSIRAGSLLLDHGPQFAADRLSGLMIGLDVASSLGDIAGQSVVLVGGNKLGKAYAKALDIAGVSVVEVDGDMLSLAGLVAAARQIWPERFASAA